MKKNNKIYTVNSKKQLDAWNVFHYCTEPALQIRHVKNLEEVVFFQGSGITRKRIAPYRIPELKTTDSEVLRIVDEYNSTVQILELAFQSWDEKRIDTLWKLRDLAQIFPKEYEQVAVMLNLKDNK